MSRKELLIVDDDAVILHMFKEAFTKAGYAVHTAESGEEALDILKQHRFHVMFLDLKLPGMNGIELCRHIKEDIPEAMAFAVTAYASIFELSDCFEAGFDDYFTKPVNLETLFKATRNAFNQIDQMGKNTE
ncbi:MAG: response regulator [Deltaproteobacteria bacterium]|nr:MAG: response regulator [Deltaproteobacteria bacterium]